MDWKKLQNNDWINKWIWYLKPRKKFYTMEEEYEYAFLEDICHTIGCRVTRIWEWPGDRVADLKHYHQRGIRGWSNRDVWGFDYYLSDVIIGGLKKLKEDKMGCPCLDGFGEHDGTQTDEQFEAMQAEWTRRLDCMIFAFGVTKQVQDNNLITPQHDDNDEYFTDEELKRQQDFCESANKPHIMFGREFTGDFKVVSKEDWQKYNDGWKYFKKHYYGLWD